MLTNGWENVQIQSPSALKLSAETIPLSRLYDSGFFVSAVFGSEAWVISESNFEPQILRVIGKIPEAMCKGMIKYNEKQYKRFIAKQQQLLASRLSAHRCQSQL